MNNEDIHRHWYQRPVVWAFVFLFLLISLMSFVAVGSLNKIENEYIKISQLHIEKLRLLDEMVHFSRQRSVLLRDIVIAEDPFRQDEIIQQHTGLATHYLLARNALSKQQLSSEERVLINEIIAANNRGYELQQSILAFAIDGEREKALVLVKDGLGPNREKIYPAMLSMRSFLVAASNKSAADTKKSMSTTRKTVEWLYIIVLMLGVVIAWVAYRLDQRYLQKLNWQATHDRLTGLLNRYQLEILMSGTAGILNEVDSKSTVIYVDIDQFNLVNNTSGHMAGDEFLRQIATSLQAIFGSDAAIARVGGDQFAIFVAGLGEVDAVECANSLAQYVDNYQFIWLDRIYNLTVSIGVATMLEKGSDKGELFSAAYLACEAAKDQGGNRVEVYKDSALATQERRRQLDWASHLKQAMNNEKLILFQQGIKSIEKDEFSHSEILLRLETDAGEMVLAGQFIPAAERYHLITDLDLYVVRKTLEFMAISPDCCSYSINLSGNNIGNKKFANQIIELINESGVDPEKICFEITETAAITNKTTAVRFMNILHGVGCHFFLDDFGSGLSSFGYLRDLPIDMVKIDNHFTRNMELDTANVFVIKAIHQIAHAFGLQTIAEGVEDQDQLDQLAKLGIDYCQGYHIEMPHRLMVA